jgi:cytochrome c
MRTIRTTMSGALVSCALLAAAAAVAGDEMQESMVELAWNSGCFNCHDLDETVRGPAWRDVAARYRDDEEAFERLRIKVRDGGFGAWGDDRMSPNRRVPMEDIDRLLRWLLILEDPIATSADDR